MTDMLTLGEGTVLVRRSDGIATITLDRPDVLNSISHDMWHGLLDAFRAVADEPSDRCVVLRGSGTAFCSGADLTDAAEGRGAAGVGRSNIDNMRKIARGLPGAARASQARRVGGARRRRGGGVQPGARC